MNSGDKFRKKGCGKHTNLPLQKTVMTGYNGNTPLIHAMDYGVFTFSAGRFSLLIRPCLLIVRLLYSVNITLL